jgi:hypothetical protein
MSGNQYSDQFIDSSFAKYVVLRHKCDSLEEELSGVRCKNQNLEKLVDFLQKELRSVLDILSSTSSLVEFTESLVESTKRYESVISDLASVALESTSLSRERAHILSLLKRAKVAPRRKSLIYGVFGLRRLKVFADEACLLSFVVTLPTGDILWTSEATEVVPSCAGDTTWSTPANAPPVELPTDLFSTSCGPRICLVVGSNIVAHTKSLTVQDLEITGPLELYQNQILLPGAELQFDSTDAVNGSRLPTETPRDKGTQESSQAQISVRSG